MTDTVRTAAPARGASGTLAVGRLTLYAGFRPGLADEARPTIVRDRGWADVRFRSLYAGVCWR